MQKSAQKRIWLAVYCKPRWEKKVNKQLEGKGIHTYCPLNRVYRKWSDRLKMVEEPLFKSYLFVQVTENEKAEVRLTDGVINFVYWNNKPAIIKDAEIEAIRKFLEEHDEVEVEKWDGLLPGASVMVTSGVMMGATGVVEKLDNKVAEVIIASIGFRLRAKIHARKLAVLPSSSKAG